ncbi:MAG: glucose-6-phosphate isomerase [Desulfobacula sp. RIFOXYA12_FULL_46_16]|nr:MAG: glucose-6-phosphate isomerase [Deltaproteobacteria bacterium RIFOXYC2_FULL_48_10]OGR20312.1 MAG: glucose-6-phosphate isomerase [Desulfobacula sp. RIFOXYA12_FULL_46_16]OGR45512.1 MAG: glucose-6-phosphate isomerase [Desulfobacula sp. RIFOXYB2_FULL_45_6]
MNPPEFCNFAAYKELKRLSKEMHQDHKHLKNLIQDPERLNELSIREDGFFFDFSKQRIDRSIFNELICLAGESKAKDKFSRMMSGEIINVTENRAVLHTATRDFSPAPVFLNGADVKPEIQRVNEQIKEFVLKIHTKEIKGTTGKAFTDAVVIGIGGSYLGCEFVFTALKHSLTPQIDLHFLPNVDIDNFGQVIKEIDPETCLWIVISKSYTTTETMANLEQALLFLKNHRLDPAHHLVTVTSKGSPGDDPSNPVLASFHMFDFIGGRYSVSSAVGGVPLSLAFGHDVFIRFLKGCRQMDLHALNAPEDKNIPLISAFISIWNSNFLDYPAQAIIPYCSALSKLAPHIQQLYMESLGKGTTVDGNPITYQTGAIIFGEPGTNAQHSFFQFAHQGSPFPVEFIGVVKPVYTKAQASSKGVYNHQELWANMIAQAQALAVGKDDDDKAKCFSGNRPSSTILINDLTPESIGLLLSFYEARTVYEGFVLGVNPFDQFGVELGKILASDIRNQIRNKNMDTNYHFDSLNPSVQFYLDTLFRGSL